LLRANPHHLEVISSGYVPAGRIQDAVKIVSGFSVNGGRKTRNSGAFLFAFQLNLLAGNNLPQGSRVLIVDDFLADGQACQGMMALCAQTGCQVVGIGVGIEKGFMPGGKNLRAMGVKLSSLAVVSGIEDGHIRLADN
jgi:hypothetical protein